MPAGRHPRWRRIGCVVLPVIVALVPASCGSSGTTDTGAQAAKASPVDFSIRQLGRGDDFSVPDEVKSGLSTITFRNGTDRPASLEFARVDGEHSDNEVVGAFNKAARGGATPFWLRPGGGVGATGPGQTQVVTQVLQPGQYYAFDTEADTSQHTVFRVHGPESGDALPRERASVSASEYTFATKGLKAGENTVTFSDVGAEPHELITAPIEAGSTIADVSKALRANVKKSPPPLDLRRTTTTAVLDSGQSQIINLDLKPGKYAFLCFVSDREGGPPHVMKGMVTGVDIR